VRGAGAFLALVATLFGLLTLLGFGGDLWWVADLAAHFRVQYALILGVAALLAGLLRRLLVSSAALVLALVNLSLVSPLWDADPAPGSGPTLTVLVLNLDATNDDHAAVAELVRARRPDVFAVLELTPVWRDALEPQLGAYDERRLEIRSGSYGVGLYSRLPLSELATLSPSESRDPLLTATVATPFGPLRLALLHPEVPSTSTDARTHLALVRVAVEAATGAAGAGAVLGDLNTTPWSARFDELLGSGLEDTREGYGLQASWPSFLPGALRIPIDHVLVTPGLAAVDREVGPDVGSDHLPVWIELAARS
jgi:endonuclease/exonuclease/phosphatase (EEP) superfamily protein YafD